MYAAIDVGTNTVRMLEAEVTDNLLHPIRYSRTITRLGGGLTEERGLAPEAMERTLATLQEFAASLRENAVDNVRAVGTAAFRVACNGVEFAERVQRETGIALETISGDTEGRLTARGVMSAVDPLPQLNLIVDIGGGSTEFVLVVNGVVVWSGSLPLGVVALTEAGLSERQRLGRISSAIESVKTNVITSCAAANVDDESLVVIGTAGTATTLAALDMKMTDYDWRKVNNYRLGLDRIQKLHAQLQPMPVPDREALPGMEVGRGDLIMPGMEIVIGLMKELNAREFIVSDFGLLEGVLLSLYKRT